MKKSRLVKVVGAGLVSVLCVPAVVQAQTWEKAGEAVIKSYKGFGGTVKYAEKVGTATPAIKNAAEIAGKVEKAVAKASQTGKIAAELAKPGISGSVNGTAVNLAKPAGEQINKSVGTGTRPAIAPAAGKKFQPNPTKYYSMSNNAEEIPTLVEKPVYKTFDERVQELLDASALSQADKADILYRAKEGTDYNIAWVKLRIADKTAKMPLGVVKQAKFETAVKELLAKETGKEVNWAEFPTGQAQETFLRDYVENSNEAVQEMFYHLTSLDKTTQAQVVYFASKHPELLPNALIDLVEEEAKVYRSELMKAYEIDPRDTPKIRYAMDMAIGKYHLNLKQVGELSQVVRDRALTAEEVLIKAEEMFGKTKQYAMANKADKVPTLTVKVPKISKDKIYGLPPAVQQGYFNGIIENMISEAARKEHGVEIDWDKVLFYGANQDKLIREYVDGLNDEMQEMFYHRVSLDKATQAKIAWAASTYNLSNCANLLAAADLTLQKFREVVLERPYYFLTDDAKKALSMVAAKYRLAIIELDDFAGTVYFSELKDPEAILQLAKKKFGAKLDKTVKSNSVQYGDDAGADTDMSPFFDEGGDVLDDFF